METYKMCEYKRQCQKYDNDSICCTFLYKLCLYRKRIIHKAELKKREEQKTIDDKIKSTKEFMDLWGNL